MSGDRRSLFLALLVLLVGRPLLAGDGSSDFVRRDGPAQLQIAGGRLADGRLESPLSGQLLLTLSVDGGPELEVKPPEQLAAEGWTIQAVAAPETVRGPAGRVRWLRRYALEPLKPGDAALQLTPLAYRDSSAESAWKEVRWTAVPLRVVTEVSSPELSELRDVAPPESLPPLPGPFPWGKVVMAVLAGVALAVVAWRLGRRWLRHGEPVVSPHQWATTELARLDVLGLPAAGHTERFHTLLSDLLRRYLDLRFQLRAGRQTTAEFLSSLAKDSPLTLEHQELLAEFSRRCDLAKFAPVRTSPEECRATAELARTFVQQTTPIPADRS